MNFAVRFIRRAAKYRPGVSYKSDTFSSKRYRCLKLRFPVIQYTLLLVLETDEVADYYPEVEKSNRL